MTEPADSPGDAVSGEDAVSDTAGPPAGWVRDLTPARVFLDRAGTSYPTSTQLALRAAHAAARDAVAAPLSLPELGLCDADAFVTAHTQAATHAQYLRRPDLGRRLSEPSRALIEQSCTRGADVQLVIGDGLSAAAVHAQVPKLLPDLLAGCERHGWSMGTTILVHRCRVGVMNEIGDLLAPGVVLLLIGERPGLATAESLSAYFGYRPRSGHTDADRNLISNIHADGVPPAAAVARVLAFIGALLAEGRGGVEVKEPAFPALNPPER